MPLSHFGGRIMLASLNELGSVLSLFFLEEFMYSWHDFFLKMFDRRLNKSVRIWILFCGNVFTF